MRIDIFTIFPGIFEGPLRESLLGRARIELGWKPTVGLDEGLRRTVAWYRDWLDRPT